MVDLSRQYLKIRDEIGKEFDRIFADTAFINGPVVKEFRENLEDYLKVRHVVPCANGTDALQIAMMALDLQPEDEVITASFTFIATAEVIALLRLTPVLVDVQEDTFNISPEAIEKAITPKTKAIVPVHLFGQCADMDAIMKIAEKHNLYVIEDAAQAIGADYLFEDNQIAKAGTIGHIGCTSFFPSKNLGCYGDGGAIFTNNDDYAAMLRAIANHGSTKRYYHDHIGVNSRLDSMQAAVLKVKLKYLDHYAEARRRAADYYDQAFLGNTCLEIPERFNRSTHVFHQYTLITRNIDRDALREYLASQNIPAMVYYPVPLHLQKAYRDERYREGDFPVTEALSGSVISLPMHTELTREQQDHIIHHVLEFTKK